MKSSRCAIAALVVFPVVIAIVGCEHAINPFVADAASDDEMITTSERKVRQQSATPTIRRREWQQAKTSYPSGQVIHWPLWWEDPFEDKGSEDGQFAWTEEDYIAIPYSVGRLMLNTIGWPVSAVVTPPGTPMVSDGRPSRQALGSDHDAIRLSKAAKERHANPGDTEGTDAGEFVEGPAAPVKNGALEGPPAIEAASHQE